MLTSQEWSDIETGSMEGIPPSRRYEWLNKSNEEQRERLGSLDIFPRRRPVLDIAEELGGRGLEEEELPEFSDGETARNLRIADRSKVPRLPKKEKNRSMHCERPLYMEGWREISKETKW